MNLFPIRKKETHKGDYGRLMILGGSRGMMGAVILAARAAMRTGAGLVYIAAPDSLVPYYNIAFPEAVIKPYPERNGVISAKAIKTLMFDLEKMTAIVAGPGFSCGDDQQQIMRSLLQTRKPLLIDADGINNLTYEQLRNKQAKVLITPHYGEFSRLTGSTVDDIRKSEAELARKAAIELKSIVLLKSHTTIITDGEKSVRNNTGNPGMATAGAGDVLSGIIGALMAMGLNLLDCAVSGAYVHGLAGDLAAATKGEYGMIASDIVEAIPSAIIKVQNNV